MLNWKENVDCCSWDGVMCDRVMGHVIGLDLSCNWLQGTIHSNSCIFLLPHLQLLNLQSLNYLDFSSCSLSGPIPTFLGSIPTWFGNLTQMSYLNLSYNNFDGQLPSSLSKLEKLNVLVLSDNHFSGSIPSWFGNLTQMSSLFLSSNILSGQIPSSLSKLHQLKFFGLTKNHFNGSIPAWLGNLTRMSSLYFSFNNFSGPIPSTLGNLTQLSSLYFSFNNFNGQILSSFSELHQLSILGLSNNQFSGSIPTWLGNLTQLVIVALSSNNFSGQIPSSLLKLEQLKYLYLSVNHFNGHFPSAGVEQLPWKNLEHLDIHSNMLEGTLPIPPLATTFFFVSNNRFTGEIPSLICNVSSLEIINLSNNSLSGIIPQCLGTFAKNLSVLDLRMNSFHGTIPKTFAKGNALRSLNLNGNKLEGLVTNSLVNCTKLEVLDLGNNNINDTFPYWLEILPNLKVLVLRSNRFHGPISDSKANHSFPELRIIDLSNNDFSGSLPTRYIENFMAMLNNSKNKVEPNYLGENYYQDSVTLTLKGSNFVLQKILTIFKTIDLSSNRFQGEIPKSIGKLTSLIVLNLSHNSLTGHIPTSLGSLRELESLDLSSNNLTGEIPMQLTSLTFLAFLNLSQNQLEGSIPQGPQFDTFQNNSYLGNLALCGFPLTKKCNADEAPQPPPSIFQKEDNQGFASGFEWKAVFMGYGCGMIFGLAIGYLIFLIGKPEWLVRIVEGKHYKNVKRSNNSAHRRRGRRN
ncbi:hypothetical protein L1049_016738 [Liquidambar formosana]|uniref:Disease resistance R13L4/SHOC-2-like LRR domain-containing protein n=1 Tax=Liquidambar formosana TaxID=63359 RepID=A0AAP0S6I9_LIQFO